MPRFVLSLSIFLLLGYCLAPLLDSFSDKYEYPIHTWTWWSVRHLRNLNEKPNVVLLGSSLMVVAMAECDATWQKKRIDLTTYREARYFDSCMSRRLGKPVKTVNLSSPGQIPSDAYLTLKEALNEGVKPELVVYGVAPRDFFDSTLSSPGSTECFCYLSRLVSANEIEKEMNDDCWNWLSRRLNIPVPILAHSTDLQMWFSNNVSVFLRKPLQISPISLEKRMQLLSDYEPLDMVPGFIHAEIAEKEKLETQYTDNLQDYIARYKKPREAFYQGQLRCLQKLIDLACENDIELKIVNMPIRKCNADLLDPSLHKRFLQDLETISRKNKIEFQNLCQFDCYEKIDYRDSVHLSAFGATKFIDRLTEPQPVSLKPKAKGGI